MDAKDVLSLVYARAAERILGKTCVDIDGKRYTDLSLPPYDHMVKSNKPAGTIRRAVLAQR